MTKFIIFLIFFFPSLALEARSIKQISIIGNKRLYDNLIKNALDTKLRQNCLKIKSHLDIKNLENLQQFSFIEIRKKNISKYFCKVIYTVKEQALLENFSLVGFDTPKKEDVQKALNLRYGEVFNRSKLQESIENLKLLYESQGLFSSAITYKIKILKNKNYDVTISVKEKKSAKIKSLQIFGNKNISSDKIKSFMQTSEKGFFSFISDSGLYKKELLNRDMQLIRYLYLQKAYYNVQVQEPRIYLDPNDNSISIIINIKEGEKYFIGDLKFESNIFDQQELKDLLLIKTGDLFSYAKFQKSISILKNLYGDKSYAFISVLPEVRIDENKKILNIIFRFNLGPSVNIKNITISGNTKTYDHVIRRELLLIPGEKFSNSKKEESISKVRYLGFFKSVDFATHSSLKNPDQLDLTLKVTPKRVGKLNLSAGYSQYLGFSFKAGIDQPNFFGMGHTLVSSVDYSKKNLLLSLSYIYPYAFNTNWDLSGSVFNSSTDRIEYQDTKTGFSFRGSKLLNKRWSNSYSYSFKNTVINLGKNGDIDLFPIATVNGIASSLGMGLTYDSRDNRLNPAAGKYFNLAYDYTGVGGDLKFSILSSQFRFYKTLSQTYSLVWKNNLDYAQLFAPGEYPFNELFLLGGPLSLRGYEWFSVGPYKFSKKSYQNSTIKDENLRRLLAEKAFGGSKKMLFQTELEFPLLSEAQIRGAVFFDAGFAGNQFYVKDIKSDLGFGIRWFSPIGPLRFEFGWPLRLSKHHNSTSKFYFYIGNSF